MSVLVNQYDIVRFYSLREKLLDALREASKYDPGKMYEGEMSFTLYHTGIYDSEDKIDGVEIKAHFYLLGPTRHYEWTGRTFKEALDRFEQDLNKYIEWQGEYDE